MEASIHDCRFTALIFYMNNIQTFRQLHQAGHPLLLANAWNVQSARIFEKSGYKAIGTSSGAVAHSLGYEDGEKISFRELLFMVERIAANITVPFTVDLEAGYSFNVEETAGYIEQLHQLGVVGINLEDSDSGAAQRRLVSIESFSYKISQIKNNLVEKKIDLFINARTDAFLLKQDDALGTTLERIKAYEAAGADGIFVPFVSDEESIRKITASTPLPVNILVAPELPSFDRLAQLGVRRISMGTGGFRAAYAHLETLAAAIQREGSFVPLFKNR